MMILKFVNGHVSRAAFIFVIAQIDAEGRSSNAPTPAKTAAATQANTVTSSPASTTKSEASKLNTSQTKSESSPKSISEREAARSDAVKSTGSTTVTRAVTDAREEAASASDGTLESSAPKASEAREPREALDRFVQPASGWGWSSVTSWGSSIAHSVTKTLDDFESALLDTGAEPEPGVTAATPTVPPAAPVIKPMDKHDDTPIAAVDTQPAGAGFFDMLQSSVDMVRAPMGKLVEGANNAATMVTSQLDSSFKAATASLNSERAADALHRVNEKASVLIDSTMDKLESFGTKGFSLLTHVVAGDPAAKRTWFTRPAASSSPTNPAAADVRLAVLLA
jgi:hypothetical protein